jgi:hypothetical protein
MVAHQLGQRRARDPIPGLQERAPEGQRGPLRAVEDGGDGVLGGQDGWLSHDRIVADRALGYERRWPT